MSSRPGFHAAVCLTWGTEHRRHRRNRRRPPGYRSRGCLTSWIFACWWHGIPIWPRPSTRDLAARKKTS